MTGAKIATLTTVADLKPGTFLLAFALDNRLSALLSDALTDAPLSPGDFGVTSALRLTEPVRPSDLAAVLGMRPTTMSNYLRRLADRGLIAREPDPHDGRAARVRLTATGTAATEACFPGFHHAATAYADALAEVGLSWDEAGTQLDTLVSAMRRASEILASGPP